MAGAAAISRGKCPPIPRVAAGLATVLVLFTPALLRAQAVAPTPRTAEGKPDLSGVYQDSSRRGSWDFEVPGEVPGVAAARPRNAAAPTGAGDPIPLTPEARARAQALLNRRSVDNPTGYCIPAPPPRITASLFPLQFVQTPQQLVILYEYMGVFRVIPTDGRPHPVDVEPSFMGDSVGRWEDDTLVVDITGFKDGVWLQNGILLSGSAHITERYTRVDRDQVNYIATVEDPNVFTKPYSIRRTFMLRDGYRVHEDVCSENNLDPVRFQEYLKKPDLLLRSPTDAAR
jgi:hypothetical protein